ncbi:MBL fold metallo-hydrolase [Granulicoccus sp. GXG6511]|uniref:MBL fold metallo-hydrolase n=1 Tax=Granulicoccus sp. GXG6511 TaxID=3381351 RepID=UPI003D7D3720
MIFTQYYLDCLSQASYLVGDESTGRAVVVDPRRDIAEYLDDANDKGLKIVGVINTHFHADFLSGHLELAKETGAWIGYGRAANPEFEFRPLADGDAIDLGGVRLEIMETPGHTPESISVLVFEKADDEVPYGVLTGDALFIGDVGRPDLLASVGTTAEELGKQLYHSVQTKLMGLKDEVRVFPAHGAGSACGKNLSTEKQSTIGEQRRFNYACQPMTEEQFLEVVTEGQPTAPGYFLFNATLNKQERELRDVDATVPALSDEEVADALGAGAVVHDARAGDEYAAGYLRGSVSVPADGRMAETAGMVFTPEQRIVIMAPRGGEQEVATRLARIGYDNVIGYIPEPEDYLVRHQDQVEPASRLRLDQLERVQEDVQLIDIRNPGEVAEGMIDGARHIPLPQLPARASELESDKPVVLYCAGGWRSAVGASFLRSRGFSDVSDLLGGYNAWSAEHAPAH